MPPVNETVAIAVVQLCSSQDVSLSLAQLSSVLAELKPGAVDAIFLPKILPRWRLLQPIRLDSLKQKARGSLEILSQKRRLRRALISLRARSRWLSEQTAKRFLGKKFARPRWFLIPAARKSPDMINSISLMSMFRIRLGVIENRIRLSPGMHPGLWQRLLARLAYRFAMTCDSPNFLRA